MHWVTPPLFTGKPPVILSAANKEAAALPPPAGRERGGGSPPAFRPARPLIVRSSGGNLDVAVSGGLKEVALHGSRPKGTNEKHFPSPPMAPRMSARLRASRSGPLRRRRTVRSTIALAKDPERQARGPLQLSYKIEDDYGVTGAEAQIAAPRRRREIASGITRS